MEVRGEAGWRWMEDEPGAIEAFRAACVHTALVLNLPKTQISNLKLMAQQEIAWRNKDVRRSRAAAMADLAQFNGIPPARGLENKGLIVRWEHPQPKRSWLDDKTIAAPPNHRLTKIGWLALELIKLAGL